MRHHLRALAALAVAAVLLTACGSGDEEAGGDEPSPTPTATSTPSPTPIATEPELAPGIVDFVSVGQVPCGFATSDDDRIFVTVASPSRVIELDPVTRTPVSGFELGADPCGATWVDGHLWVAQLRTGVIDVVDVDTGTSIAQVQLSGNVWDFLVEADDDRVTLIDRSLPGYRVFDTQTFDEVQTVRVTSKPTDLLRVGDELWVTREQADAILRLDADGQELGEIPTGDGPLRMVEVDGQVFVTISNDNTVQRIDTATKEVVETVAVGQDPRGISLVDGFVWVGNNLDGTLARIDPATMTVVISPYLANNVAGVTKVADDDVYWLFARFNEEGIPRWDPSILDG